MDLKSLAAEDFAKKSNKYLLDLISQLDVDNRGIQAEMLKLLDKQDLILAVYNNAMSTISQRGGN